MVAFDVADRTGGEAPGAVAKAVCARAPAAGLIVLTCGAQGQAIRILVPLTASDAIVDEGMQMLEIAVSGEVAPAPESHATASVLA